MWPTSWTWLKRRNITKGLWRRYRVWRLFTCRADHLTQKRGRWAVNCLFWWETSHQIHALLFIQLTPPFFPAFMPLAFYIIKGYSDAHKMHITRNNQTDRKINCFNNYAGFLNCYFEVLHKHSAAAMITDSTDSRSSCGCWAVQIKLPSMGTDERGRTINQFLHRSHQIFTHRPGVAVVC